jgi:5-(carboxyamino)imidazole ribonucleotide synthase
MRLLVLGGGQLALMMCWAAARLPMEFFVHDPDPRAPAYRCAKKAEDPLRAVDEADYVTYEFENIDEAAADYAQRQGKLRPHIDYLKLKKNRIAERETLQSLGVPVPRWTVARNPAEALAIAEKFGRAVAKWPAGGYDGKGQYLLPRETPEGGTLLVEEYVDIRREFSIVAVRGEDGDIYFYPPAENYYVDGVLVWNYAPTDAPPEAYRYVEKILEWRKYVGVLAVEFFEDREGRILVNEIAPRVHNTGHWTLETDASQFENHVRAVMGLSIKRPQTIAPTAMVNILGLAAPPIKELERLGKVYWYGKAEARPRRKMGHINIVASTAEEAKARARAALKILYGGEFPRLVMRPRAAPRAAAGPVLPH